MTQPASDAPISKWETWRDQRADTEGLSETDKFFYELGQGVTSLSGQDTPFLARIEKASATPEGHDPVKLADVLANIKAEHAPEIAEIQAKVRENAADALAAFNARMAVENAKFDAPTLPPPILVGATPVIPVGHSQVEVPPEYIPYLPTGMILAKHDEAGTFAAVVPKPHGEHHFFAEVGESLHRFLMRIAAVFGHKEHP